MDIVCQVIVLEWLKYSRDCLRRTNYVLYDTYNDAFIYTDYILASKRCDLL